MMNQGKLKNPILIKEKKTTKDPVTKLPKEEWVDFCKCWAEIEQPKGRSFYQAAVAHLEYVTWFHIRYKKGIKPGMRVLFHERSYEIEEVKQDLQNKQYTTLQCKEVI